MLLAALVVLAQASRPELEPGPLAIQHVTVLDLETGTTSADRTVLVRAGRIEAVGPSAEVAAPAGARAVDGRGHWLIPGLVDAHVHVSERDLPLFLANGVTAVRELNGSPAHIALRARIAAGELVGPRMQVASTLLAGERQRWRHELLLDPIAAGERAESFAEGGYDALKVYDGLAPEVYDVIAEV